MAALIVVAIAIGIAKDRGRRLSEIRAAQQKFLGRLLSDDEAKLDAEMKNMAETLLRNAEAARLSEEDMKPFILHWHTTRIFQRLPSGSTTGLDC